MVYNILSPLLFYSRCPKPTSIIVLPFQASLELQKASSLSFSIDQVTNKLFIFSRSEEGDCGKFRVFQGNKLARVVDMGYLTRIKRFIVSNPVIYSCGVCDVISKLSSSGDLLAKVGTPSVEDFCFSKDRFDSLHSDKIFVFDQDLRILFKVALLDTLDMPSWIIVKFNFMFVITQNTLGYIEMYIYSLEGDFVSQSTIVNPSKMCLFNTVVGMDSLGDIITHYNLIEHLAIQAYSAESFGMIDLMDLGSTKGTYKVAIDNQDRIVTLSNDKNSCYVIRTF